MSVPAPIDKKSYLQKYLKGTSGDKKKKKRKNIKGKGFKIIDDDIDVSRLQPLDIDELDILGEGEDAPQIAGIIDDRPEELRKSEQFTSSKWRVINQDDGFTSKLEIEEIKQTVKEKEKENELIFGKMYSDSEEENKNDSDLSPPRKQSSNKSKENATRSDSDLSLPRQNIKEHNSRKRSQSNDDSDLSPPRKHSLKTGHSRNKNANEVKVRKQSRWESVENIERNKSQKNQIQHSRKSKKGSSLRGKSSDSDMSPPRISQKTKRRNSESPKRRDKSDSDMSPPRKNNLKRSDGKSRKSRSESDSDLSPPRKNKKTKRENSESTKRCNKWDSDISPPRKNNLKRNNGKSRKSRSDSNSDMSPPRKSKESYERRSKYDDNDKYKNKRQHRNKSSDSDLSPPRKNRPESSHGAINRQHNRHYGSNSSPIRDKRFTGDSVSRRDGVNRSDSPPPSNKKMEKTLEGKRAGLQNAQQLKIENDEFRRREDNAFSRMNDDVSGRNAKAVSRKSKRETSEERQKQKEKAEKQRELDEKYKKWSKGLKQIEVQEARVQEMLHEASKPLARFKDDRDLERDQRDIEREGDPMLQYIRERKRERGELPPAKPTYKGSFPPNRFNIRPGYRWDGVDRSSGYEKKYFEQKSKRKAQEEEAYKWSMEDL